MLDWCVLHHLRIPVALGIVWAQYVLLMESFSVAVIVARKKKKKPEGPHWNINILIDIMLNQVRMFCNHSANLFLDLLICVSTDDHSNSDLDANMCGPNSQPIHFGAPTFVAWLVSIWREFFDNLDTIVVDGSNVVVVVVCVGASSTDCFQHIL